MFLEDSPVTGPAIEMMSYALLVFTLRRTITRIPDTRILGRDNKSRIVYG